MTHYRRLGVEACRTGADVNDYGTLQRAALWRRTKDQTA